MHPAARWLGLTFACTTCAPGLDPCAPAAPGAVLECAVPGVFDRGFSLRVPTGWDGRSALPVVIAFHGGGGNRVSADRVTCATGEPGTAGCLSTYALAAGFAVVSPDGTGLRPLRNVRSWNAGGGNAPWHCISRGACQSGVDDEAFFDQLLTELRRLVPVDPRRVFLTGLSNGGAISHRLACARPDVVAAIAAVGGENQYVAAGGRCARGAAVLQIHGTEDQCWGFATGTTSCAFLEAGYRVGFDDTLDAWRRLNGCTDTFVDAPLPDAANDGTRSVRRAWTGCARAVEGLRVEGGGHTWPGGQPYLSEGEVGRVSRDFNASETIVSFFHAHPRP